MRFQLLQFNRGEEIDGLNPIVYPNSYFQMQDYEEVSRNYEHCTTSVSIQVHTYQGKTATINQGGKSDGPNPDTVVRPESYLELDSNQMQDDGTEEMDITNYEHCSTFDSRPVHTYERRKNVIEQERRER